MCFLSHTAIIDEDILRYERVKKKAYVKVVTSRGPLNLELHSDMVSIGQWKKKFDLKLQNFYC